MAGESMSVREAAQALGRSSQWVTELIRRGEIPARRLDQRTWLIDRVGFQRYLDRLRTEERDRPKV